MRKLGWTGLAGAVLGGWVSVASAATGDGCDPGLRWLEDGNQVLTRMRAPAVVLTLRRYQDALRIDAVPADGPAKGILALDGGPELIFGSSDPREFMDAGMPAMLPAFFLMKHYASPCAVPVEGAVDFQVARDSGFPGPVRVTGTVRRAGSRIDYELHVAAVAPPPGQPAALIDASGSWAHVPPAPIGADTDLRGWKVVDGVTSVAASAAPATVAEARAWARRPAQH